MTDQVLELIRERADKITKQCDGVIFDFNETQRVWDAACVEIHNKFSEEGLYKSATDALKHLSIYKSPPKPPVFIIPENVEKWTFAGGGKLAHDPDDHPVTDRD